MYRGTSECFESIRLERQSSSDRGLFVTHRQQELEKRINRRENDRRNPTGVRVVSYSFEESGDATSGRTTGATITKQRKTLLERKTSE